MSVAAVTDSGPVLNEEQAESAYHPPVGASLTEAGAGSGKTSMLKQRVSYILRYRDAEYDPLSKVLVMVFNAKNAAELKEYFQTKLNHIDATRVVASTFHSQALTMLYKFRKYSAIRAPDFSIAKTHHMAQSFADWAHEQHGQFFSQGNVLMMLGIHASARAKNISVMEQLSTAKRYVEKLNMAEHQIAEWVARFYEWRLDTGAIAHSDTLPLANGLPARCFQLMGYKDVVADELQDLNYDQRTFTRKLMQHAESFTGVGDPHQSIFGFAGADADIFMRMRADYPAAKMFTMTYNYRCTDQIIAYVNKILELDINTSVRLRGTGRQGPEPLVYTDGVDGLISWLNLRHDSGEEWRDIAVLYRTRSQVSELEMALSHSGIPYVLSDAGFFEQKVVLDMMAYLNLIYLPRPDRGDWRRIFDHFAGVGPQTAAYVWVATDGDPLAWGDRTPAPAARSAEGEAGWNKLIAFLKEIRRARKDVVAVVERLIEFLGPRWEEYYGESEKLQVEAVQTANAFLSWVVAFEGAKGLDVVQTVRELENGNRKQDERDVNAIRVMTFHKAKGLEWNSVGLWGVSDGTYPLQGETVDAGEERRLGYVGGSRAKTHLALFCPTEAARFSTFARHVQDARITLFGLIPEGPPLAV